MSKRGHDKGSDDDYSRSAGKYRKLLERLQSIDSNNESEAEDSNSIDISGSTNELIQAIMADTPTASELEDPTDADDEDSHIVTEAGSITSVDAEEDGMTAREDESDGEVTNDSDCDIEVNNSGGAVSSESNAPGSRTELEVAVSESGQPDEQAADADGEGNSPLRVPKKNEGSAGTSTSRPEPESNPDEEQKRIDKRPTASELKIHPKTYARRKIQENNPEQSIPSAQLQSDESEDEGKPKRKLSQKWEEEVNERRPLKTPPRKEQ